MTYIQVTCCSCIVDGYFENKQIDSFVSKSQDLKMALCDVLIGEIRLFYSIDSS